MMVIIMIGLMVLSAAAGAVGGYWFCNRNIAKRVADEVQKKLAEVK